ncbi:MAG: hypothetical protein ACI9TH_000555 [Kiritimatiellia bacterium]|jgi:hypothetical protein
MHVAQAAPPFSGTIFLDPDIITESDSTTYQSIIDTGRGDRWMFDRRVNDWVFLNAFLFEAHFDDGLEIEIQVNPEFGSANAAMTEASKYAPIIGRLPTCLRRDVETVWIHQGVQPFGGGNNNLLIHTGQADQYATDGILEETLVHEASHTSLDADHAGASGWLAAQAADPEFISTYARDNPNREDIAESFLLYLALKYRPGRISQSLSNTISQTIPNRIAYFASQEFDFYPIVVPEPLSIIEFTYGSVSGVWLLRWTSGQGKTYAVEVSTNQITWDELVSGIPSQGTTTSLTQTNTEFPNRIFFKVGQLEQP